jgi:23S rRNA (guanine745-N1)-methyltransferase
MQHDPNLETKRQRQYYTQTAAAYDQMHNAETGEHALALKYILGFCRQYGLHRVLDVGCGEGYYFTHINATDKYGIDISKKAVQMASKLLPDAHFAVASAFRLPIIDHSCAAVFSVFAPHSFEEYARVLQPGGTWVTVTPGPHHLQQMRPKRDQSIGEREERRSEPPAQAQHAERIQFELDLSPSAANDLFSMTPLVWQTAADASPTTQVSVDVWVSSGTSL